jgi:DNA-binding response OmpR family regulator
MELSRIFNRVFMNGKTKVLIVEDETPLAMFMVSVLTRFDCEVTVAPTGQKAMELASERRYDLITLDIGLPDATGYAICSDLKQRHISYKTPVIFISASPRQQDIDEAKAHGAVDYLCKPFDTSEFVYKVIYYARAQRLMSQELEGRTA